MKRLLTILIVFATIARAASSAAVWYVNVTNGDDVFGTGTIVNPMRTITGVVNTGALQNGDIINIAAGIYTDCPTIPNSITINGQYFNAATDVVFDLSTANMIFTMSGTTTFTFDATGGTNGRFRFIGSDNTGIVIHSGKVLLSTANFHVVPPFLFQTGIPAESIPPPSTWYVDCTNGDDVFGIGTSVNPFRTITKAVTVGAVDDGVIINVAAGSYTESPSITKNIIINGYGASGNTDIVLNLTPADMAFTMTGRTVLRVNPVGSNPAAARYHFTGSATSGIHIVSGCVHTSNAVLDFTPPFLFQGENGSTGIVESESRLGKFNLMQCYPNPFNPSTVIRFRVDAAVFTTLKVYDTAGKEVATLVGGVLHPGTYERTFDASGLASGVYVYRLQSGGFAASKKFVLVK